GIRDDLVTGVQTCALPISALTCGADTPFARPHGPACPERSRSSTCTFVGACHSAPAFSPLVIPSGARNLLFLAFFRSASPSPARSEERRVGIECRSGCAEC